MKKIKQERMQFQQAKPMLAGILDNMKQTVVFHLPGNVTSSSNFTKNSSGTLGIQFDGAKLMAVMEKLVNDDDWCRKHAAAGFDKLQDKPLADDEINQWVFGEKSPVRAVIAPGAAPLFNYAIEVADAKKEYAKIRKELGVGTDSSGLAEPLAPPAQGGALKSVKVVGVRLVTQSDQKRNLRPFNYDTGYWLALLVEFPGSVQSVTDESVLETALADDGSSLLPESKWDRKIHFPRLSTDKTAAIFELRLKVPGAGVKGLKELAGRLYYNVASGTRDVDLGFEELKAGAAGTELGARIESIKEGWRKDGSQMMGLKLNTNPDGIKSLSLVVDGVKTPLEQNGYGGGGHSYTFTYLSKQAFPAKGRLVAEVYDKLQTFETPFKLENISLLGASSKSE